MSKKVRDLSRNYKLKLCDHFQKWLKQNNIREENIKAESAKYVKYLHLLCTKPNYAAASGDSHAVICATKRYFRNKWNRNPVSCAITF